MFSYKEFILAAFRIWAEELRDIILFLAMPDFGPGLDCVKQPGVEVVTAQVKTPQNHA